MSRAALAMAVLGVMGASLLVYQGARIVELEHRLAAAERLLGLHDTTPPASAAPTGDKAPDVGIEPRLANLEHEVRALRDDLATLEKATETTLAMPMPTANADPQQILSVVTKEQERIRDRQLEFHRSRWQQGRDAALEQFSIQQNLAPEQKQQLKELLESETDRLIEILRRPKVLEDPEQAAADWQAVLHDTDQAAHGVLAGPQIPHWDIARSIERRILWPWLPPE